MKPPVLALVCLGLLGCAGRGVPSVERPEPGVRGRIAPGGERLAAHLAERLPGVRSVSLLRLVRWAERTPGPCTADFAVGEGAARLDLEVETGAGKSSFHGAGLEALIAAGWTLAYRSPAGVGADRVDDFRSFDLTMRQTLECRCFGAERTATTYPTTLRFRWSAGKPLEASAAVERDGRTEALRPALTVGHLVTYAFAADEAFPKGRAGTCSAHLEASAVVEPPLR